MPARPPTRSARLCPRPPLAPRSARAGVTEIQSQLPGIAAFPGDLQQHGELVIGVGRADMFNTQYPPAPLGTIWTAVAPEAVFAPRTNTPIP